MDIRRIRVFVVDDHPVVLRGLESVIIAEVDMDLVGMAADGQTAIAEVSRLQPDVALVDMRLPDMSGTNVTHRLQQAAPDTRVISLTAYEDAAYLKQAWAAGSHGYLMKHAPPEELLKAIRAVARGERFVAPALLSPVLDDYRTLLRERQLQDLNLTTEELDLLRYLSEGLSYRALADRLHYSEATLKRRAKAVFAKLGAPHRAQAIAMAMHHGLL